VEWVDRVGAKVKVPLRVRQWVQVASSRYMARDLQYGGGATACLRRINDIVTRLPPRQCLPSVEANLRKHLHTGQFAPVDINPNRTRASSRSPAVLFAPSPSFHLCKSLHAYLVRVKACRRWRKVRVFVDVRSTAFYWDRCAQERHFAPPVTEGASGGREYEAGKLAFEQLGL